ncbi:ATP-binding protein [Pseudomonas solani]|uniref:ATP-binding protein n=1 Tax=Pseudomonas solani TaxID=2731552 RepID=UPI003D6BA422
MNWPRGSDTIARWIALTIVMAMLASLLLNWLFVELAGVWAQPSLLRSGVLERAALATQIIEAAPEAQRSLLARAASAPNFSVRWVAGRNQLTLPPGFDDGFQDDSGLIEKLFGEARHLEAYDPEDWPPPNADRPYQLLVKLHDGSWLEFSARYRSWGLDPEIRLGIIAGLALVASLAVAWVATRRLARPLESFAHAARRFGSDFRAPPIEPLGPREIRQAILAFNTMQAQIRHFVADRSQMLASISHDLRAPLTRMRLRGEFIDDPEQQRKLFRDVDEMQGMINAALDFFRDDARLEPATPFDLAELLQTLIDDYRDQGIDIPYSGPTKLVYLGRPLGLKRVFTNLLENALKYAHAPAITLHTDPRGILIDVSDQGPGIPEQHLEEVFEPFYRLEPSRNPASGGVGLGLSAARAIAREHGGELHLHNRPEGGLRARVELPWS